MKITEIKFAEPFTRPGASTPVDAQRLVDVSGSIGPHGVTVLDAQSYLIPWPRISYLLAEDLDKAEMPSEKPRPRCGGCGERFGADGSCGCPVGKAFERTQQPGPAPKRR